MNNNIKAALAAKAEKTLDKMIRVDGKLFTRREWLNAERINGAKVKDVLDHPFDWNRTKYNRMGWDEQAAYEKRYNTKVTKYRLYTDETTFYEITKTEYEYFNNMALAEDLETEKSQLPENELMAKEFEFAAKYF